MFGRCFHIAQAHVVEPRSELCDTFADLIARVSQSYVPFEVRARNVPREGGTRIAFNDGGTLALYENGPFYRIRADLFTRLGAGVDEAFRKRLGDSVEFGYGGAGGP